MAALLERVRRNDPPGIRSLVRAGADVNARDRNGFMALHVACVCGHRSVVELLLQAGADANARDAFGFAALHMAAQEGRRDVVELLVRSGAPPWTRGTRTAARRSTGPRGAGSATAWRSC